MIFEYSFKQFAWNYAQKSFPHSDDHQLFQAMALLWKTITKCWHVLNYAGMRQACKMSENL